MNGVNVNDTDSHAYDNDGPQPAPRAIAPTVGLNNLRTSPEKSEWPRATGYHSIGINFI
jgi:hypothetical protein